MSWRVEGQQVTRRLTIGAGATLTGVGQAVRIEMYDATPEQFYKTRRVPGTATVTTGSPDVVLSLPPGDTVGVGQIIIFSTQPKVQYTIEEVSGVDITLTTPYTGSSSAAAVATSIFEQNVSYGVSVQVSAGVRGASGQPPLLQPYDGPPYVAFDPNNPSPGTGFIFDVDASSEIDVTIPEDAGITQVYVTATGDSATLTPGEAFGVVGNIAPQRSWDTQVTPGWIPVPPGAQKLTLVNRSGTQSISFSCAFGIDG